MQIHRHTDKTDTDTQQNPKADTHMYRHTCADTRRHSCRYPDPHRHIPALMHCFALIAESPAGKEQVLVVTEGVWLYRLPVFT